MKALRILIPAVFLLSHPCLPATAREPPRGPPFPPAIHPALARRLLQARPEEPIPVLIEVEGPFLREIAAQEQKDQRPLSERRARLVARLRARAEATQAALLRRLQEAERAGEAGAIRPLWLSNQIAARITPHRILDLSREPGVRRIREDRFRHWITAPPAIRQDDPLSTPWNLAQIHAPEAWAAFGITGTGVVVANIDTGAGGGRRSRLRLQSLNGKGVRSFRLRNEE